eukprot:992602-Rhodomonas_salina.3
MGVLGEDLLPPTVPVTRVSAPAPAHRTSSKIVVKVGAVLVLGVPGLVLLLPLYQCTVRR